MRNSTLVFVSSLVLMTACGGGKSSSPSPTAPSTPTPPVQQNRAPQITSMNFAPAFGIMGQTQFAFNASASDPDGDTLTYAWDVAGNAFTGTNGNIVFTTGGSGTARLTVTDSKGLTVSDTRNFTVGTMTGGWLVTSGFLAGATFNLTQTTAGNVTGSFSLPGIGNGNTDPAQPGRIDSNGALTMRVKIGPFTDFNMNGTMDNTGVRITGSLHGSGFSGDPFTMVKQ